MRDLRDGFDEHDLLTYASAISFQVLFALVPLALAVLAVLGFLGLEEVYAQDFRPRLRESLGDAAFRVVDETIHRVVTSQRTLWLSFGVLLALWEISSAIRAAMGAFGRIYGQEEDRSLWPRVGLSVLLGVPVLVAGLGAVLAVTLGSELVDLVGQGTVVSIAGFAARWGTALALLLATVGILLAWAPPERRPFRWITLGSVVVVVLWVVSSLGFYLYITQIAQYGTVFGNLASVIVLMTWIYIVSIALVGGVLVDALLRDRSATSG